MDMESVKAALVFSGLGGGGGSGTDPDAVHYTADADRTETQKAQARANIGAAEKPEIKSTMDSVAVAGTQYYLGNQASVDITLPNAAEIGQQISVIFYSGETAATLSVDGDVIGDTPTPAVNQRVEINLLWDGTFWALLSNLLTVPAEETV